MRTATRILTISVYCLFATGYLVVGGLAALFNTGLLPAVKDHLVEEAKGNLAALHVVQEFGSALVFLGLITFWFVRNYDRSLVFHWAMTAFWALIALVHWLDVQGPPESVVGTLFTSGPAALFVSLGLLRMAVERDGKAEPVMGANPWQRSSA